MWSNEKGFTLIEVMVALIVFGLAALALVKLDSATIRSSNAIERRQLARLVVNNLAVEVLTDPVPPPIVATEGDLTNAALVWHWRRRVDRQEGLVRIDLTVFDSGGQALASQTIVRAGL
jgi:general secretion pathway protein I